jgi:predicted MFS family arabinose efflux permease
VLAFIGHFAFCLGLWTFVHLPGYLEGLGGGQAEIGIIIGVLSVSAIVFRPTIGRLMDRRGRRPVVLGGAAINLVAVCAYLTADSLGPWIYLIRILHGVGQASLFSVFFTIAADVVPASRRTEGIAIFGVSGLLPLSLGGLLGDIILKHWDYSVLFLASALFSLIALLLCTAIPETRPARKNDGPPTRLVAIFLASNLIPLWILTFGFTCGLTSYFTFLKTYIGETQVGSVGLFFLAYSIAAVVCRLFFSWIPAKVGLRRMLIPMLFSLSSGILVLAYAQNAAMVAIAGVLCGLGHAYVFPIISALVVSRADDDDRGAAMTMYTALFDLGALVGAPLFGWIIERSSYQTMFVTAVSFVVFFSVVFFVVDRRLSPSAT